MSATVSEPAQLERLAQDALDSSRRDPTVQLAALLRVAEEAVQFPLRPIAENNVGYIETIAIDPSGLLWMTGWIHKGQSLEFPAVLVDRQKVPASVMLTCYDRPDLPQNACAVFGIIQTEWRPSSATTDLFLFFGEEMRFYLRSVKPLQLRDTRMALEEFERVRAFCYGARTNALQRMLNSIQNWAPDTARVAGFPVDAHVDQALVLPGFGCMIEGWVVSPLKRIERFILKFGDRLLHSDSAATYFKGRLDLGTAFPHCTNLLSHAGFVALFRGPLPTEELTDPILKLVFTDGTSTNHRIEPTALRRLGHSAALDDAFGLFPALPHETFFCDLAATLRAEAASRLRAPEPFVRAPAARAIILAVPNDRSDAFLLFNDVLQRTRELGNPPGLVFVSERGADRSSIVSLFGNLTAVCAAPCSLFFVDDVHYTLYLMADILRAVGATRFLFVGPGVFLNAATWPKVLGALDNTGTRIDFFEVTDELPASEAGASVFPGSASCFAWSTAAFIAWAPKMPLFIDGLYGDNELRKASTRIVVHRGAACRTEAGTTRSRLALHVNLDALARSRELAAHA